jgi:hypothetical protein
MSRLALVLVVTLAATGCTRRQADFAWFAVAVAAEVANAAATSDTYEGQPGVAVAAPNPDLENPVMAQRSHEIAMELTKLASHSARSENCSAVANTGAHVQALDQGVYTNVFMTDEAIQRCLAPSP